MTYVETRRYKEGIDRTWRGITGSSVRVGKFFSEETKRNVAEGYVVWINGEGYSSEQVDEIISTLQEFRYRSHPNEGYTTK